MLGYAYFCTAELGPKTLPTIHGSDNPYTVNLLSLRNVIFPLGLIRLFATLVCLKIVFKTVKTTVILGNMKRREARIY